MHGGGFATYHQAREDRRSRLEELLRRWEEEHAKLKELVLTLKTKSAFNDGLASRYQAAQTRLRKFEEAGPPTLLAREQNVRVRLHGGRTAKRAVVATGLELTGLMKPFDLEVWFGERVAVLGSNGSGKSHFLRLLAAGGSDPSPEHEPADDTPVAPVTHTGRVVLGPRVRPGWFAQNHGHPELVGRTLLEILHRGDGHRSGIGREQASQGARPVRARRGRRAAVRDALGRSAGAAADPAARARGSDAAAARRADGQPRPALGRGARDGPGRVRGHGPGGDARPLVHAHVRPVPRVRRGRRGVETPEPVWDVGRVDRVR